MNRACRAHAIGHGIKLAIRAEGDGEPTTPADWIAYCLKAAKEAETEARDSMEPEEGSAQKLLRELHDVELDGPAPEPPEFSREQLADIHECGAIAFRHCIPQVTCRRNLQSYIGCVAQGVAHRYITAAEAKSLLYTAQIALSAFPKRKRSAARRSN